MRKKQVYTLTIAVPAFNEEQTVRFLLESILTQHQTIFKLERILITSDGSSDQTDRVIKAFVRRHKIKNLTLFNDGKRKGKCSRVNEFFSRNKSDILLILDADIVLSTTTVLDSVIRNFSEKEVALVAPYVKPFKPDTFVGMLIVFWEEIWYHVRKDVNHGENIYNIKGSAIAVRKDLVKKERIPRNLQQIGRYLYFLTVNKKRKFRFAQNAVIWYRCPGTFSDFVSVLSRNDETEKLYFAKKFGEKAGQEYKISFSKKIGTLGKMALKNPILTFLTITFIYVSNFLSRRTNSMERPGIWKTVASTKKAISV